MSPLRAIGGMTRAIGKLGNSVGLDLSYSSGNSRTVKTRVYYPPVPVNRSIYPDCNEAASDDYESCQEGLEQCNEGVDDTVGEVCEEAMSLVHTTSNSTPLNMLTKG